MFKSIQTPPLNLVMKITHTLYTGTWFEGLKTNFKGFKSALERGNNPRNKCDKIVFYTF